MTLVITDTVAWLGGPGVSVYISVCVCVCVCVCLLEEAGISMIDSCGSF